MIRFISYLILITALSLAGSWLFENNGYISIDWMDYRIETSVAFAGIALAALLFVTVVTLEILLWLKKAPGRISSDIAIHRNIKGLSSLTEGFVALLDGDITRAQQLAKTSRKLLPAQPFTLLLSAETAKMTGDKEGEQKYLNAMLANKATEVLALKGLVGVANAEANFSRAINLAEKAHDLKPKSNWTTPVLIDLYKKTNDWEEAKNVIDGYLKKNSVRKFFRRDNASDLTDKILKEKSLITLMLSKKYYSESKVEKAYRYAKEAYNLNPDFIPAVVNLCNAMLALGKRNAARALVEKVWRFEPNPELYEIYYKIYPDEKALKKLKRFERLIAINPESAESYKAVAELAIDLGAFEIAKTNLDLALLRAENKTLLKMRAKVAELLGEPAELREQYLKKAEFAEEEPTWVCENCGNEPEAWDLKCKKCGSFNSLSWKPVTKVVILEKTA